MKKQLEVDQGYIEKLERSAIDFNSLNEKILVLGFIMDGSFSLREKIKVAQMKDDKVLTKTKDEIEALAKQFVLGKGV